MMKRIITNFQGINRNNSGQSAGDGACEELINVRNDGNMLRVVRKHKAILQNSDAIEYFEHRVGTVNNRISVGFDKTNNTYYIRVFEIIYNGSEEIVTGAYTQLYTSSARISVKTLNNMLIINDNARDNTIVYHYLNGEYKLQYDGLPSLPAFSITKKDYDGGLPPGLSTTYYTFAGQQKPIVTRIEDLKYETPEGRKYLYSTPFSAKKEAYLSEEVFRETILSAINEARQKSDNYSEGYFLLSLNYTLVNGDETKMTAPVMIEVGKAELSPIIEQVVNLNGGALENIIAAIKGQAVDITLSNVDYSQYKDLIKSVNIYTTEIMSHLDLDVKKMTPAITHPNHPLQYTYEQRESFVVDNKITHETLKNKLFFRQKELLIENLSEVVSLVFNTGKLTTEKTMKVDSSGWLRTKGKSFIYNNRLHLYDYERKFTPEASIFSNMNYVKGVANTVAGAHVRVSNSDGKAMYINGSVQIYFLLDDFTEDMKVWLADLVSFPDSRAEYLYIYFGFQGKKYAGKLSLSPSSTYNYAYSVNITNETTPTMICKEVVSYDLVDEDVDESVQNAIIVSSPGAPYHFPVEHSYRISGKVRNLCVMAEDISAAQVGQYPLFVFTDAGIFALQQGTGTVLYSNLLPISSDIADSVCQTKYGIAYSSGGNVYFLSGRSGSLLSHSLDAVPDLSIRSAQGYNVAHGSIELYSVSSFLSHSNFKLYAKRANLVYDAIEEELIVSNPIFSYSYVFNLRNKAWHKVSDTYLKNDSSSRYVTRRSWVSFSPSQPARAKISINAMTVRPAMTFAYLNRCEFANANTIIPAGNQMTLVIGTNRLASYYTQTAMPLYLVIEMICASVSFIEQEYNSFENVCYIYTNQKAYNNKIVFVKNADSTILHSDGLVEMVGNVIIEKKGIDEQVMINIAGRSIPVAINSNDTYVSLAGRITDLIRASASDIVSAEKSGNIIYLTSRAFGSQANDIILTSQSSLYCIINSSTFTGGQDVGATDNIQTQLIDTYLATEAGEMVTTEDGYYVILEQVLNNEFNDAIGYSSTDIIDLYEREGEEDDQIMIHIQSRPVILGSAAYKSIKRASLRADILTSGRPFGAYLYASNDLKSWRLVSYKQVGKDTANIRLDRVHTSYRYYIIAAGGYVRANSNISYFEIEAEEKLSGKIR